MLFRQVFLVIVMYVFVQLWRTTYSWEAATSIAGFTMGQMMWYLALTESMVMAMPTVGRTIDDEVKSGSGTCCFTSCVAGWTSLLWGMCCLAPWSSLCW